ncbi:type IV pilus modification PilV family protein [Roseateles sp. DB2]|uniref:type IV pilus modification PilV family protein n=1 Tax=Roseateles sp. DB2 TaxID=3453717 RepID=UPI003EEFDE55
MKPRQISSTSRRSRRGIALLEALIGILIFAFGVLGLMGLQAAMTKAQSSAKFRADAANLASDLFGLIQTDNPAMISKYATASCASYARCKDWLTKVSTTLPGDLAPEITVDAGPGKVELRIRWQQGTESENQYRTSMVWQQ